jgi:pimeloyl-ACP methyl ester carboxylesterase
MSPKENAAWLAAHLPERLPTTVDIVAHSRGGLVVRTIVEHGAEFGLDTRLRVRRLIMVATPNAGTTLADPQHLERFMNRLTNIAQLIPGTSVTRCGRPRSDRSQARRDRCLRGAGRPDRHGP